MGRNKALARREERRKNRTGRVGKALAGQLAYVLLGGAVVFFAVVVVVAARHIPSSTAESPAAATKAAAAADAGEGWIRLTAKSPSAIIAAARKTSLFNVNRSGDGDYLKDLSHLESPVLVKALNQPGAVVMPDYYVIPIDDVSGSMVGAAELELNPTHTAIRMTAIITYSSPRPHGQMAHVPQSKALADLSGQRRVAMRAGAQAQLVYIPIDATQLETGEVQWTAGGQYPADPVWLIPGSDGNDHVVGTNDLAYNMSDLPVMKAQP